MTRFSPDKRIRDIYAHPLGRDVIDKILLQLGLSPRWLDNPLVGNLRLRHLDRLSRRFIGPTLVNTLIRLLNTHPDRPRRSSAQTEPAWWKEAVFYQIYPRSFQDSNGDGLGDLRGIISRLDYLADLGVDCLWLSPIFDSPNEDMGYDVRDYRAVMAEMGTMADLDELIAESHARGMRIILDLVVNHTSAEHAWFKAAEEDPDGPYGDYYFLRRGHSGGELGPGAPPNNWDSFFSGSAWRWLTKPQRWGLHLFAPGQMDLNWDNPAVRREVNEIVQFWLERGIDGFRLDVINYISKQPGLPSGDEFIGTLMGFTGIEHYFAGPQLHAYLRELRARGFTREVGRVPASTVRARSSDGSLGDPMPPEPTGVMVGETPGIGIEMGRLLSGANRGELDLVFNFDVLETPGKNRWDDYRYDLNYLKDFYEEYQSRIGPEDWIALFLENHDNPRMISKVLGADDRNPRLRAAVARVIATIQLTMRGTPFLFQGQELAAINQEFEAITDLRDVESLNRYAVLAAELASDPKATAPRKGGRGSRRGTSSSDVTVTANHTGAGDPFEGILAGSRDHARVPMRWVPDGEAGGFTTAEPWLPGKEDSLGFTASEQLGDPTSVLAWYQGLIRLRRSSPAFTYGDIEFIAPGAPDYFAWYRTNGSERWLVEMNLSATPTERRNVEQKCTVALGTVTVRREMMGPYEVVIARVS